MFLSSAPPGLVSYIVNRWFAPPANFHQPSGLNSARNRSTPAFEVQCAITVNRSPPASRAARRSPMREQKKGSFGLKGLTCERRALPRNLAGIIKLQPWQDFTNMRDSCQSDRSGGRNATDAVGEARLSISNHSLQ